MHELHLHSTIHLHGMVLNPLKPSDYYISIICFNILKLCILFSQITAIIFLNGINRLGFVVET
jgi:hypothetical protein